MEIDKNTMYIHGINGEVVSISYIKNIMPIKVALKNVLDRREIEKTEVVQTQALLGLSQMAFPKKENNGCAAVFFWLVIVPMLGIFLGVLFTGIL